MATTIDLGKSVKLVIQEAIVKTINIPEVSINIDRIIVEEIKDIPGVSVYADVLYSDDDKQLKHVLLWDGEDYVKIGQYTDADIATRILEIFAPSIPPTE